MPMLFSVTADIYRQIGTPVDIAPGLFLLESVSIGVTLPNRREGAEEEKCSRCRQNPAEMGFLFKFDPLSCHHWGAVIGPSQSSVIQIGAQRFPCTGSSRVASQTVGIRDRRQVGISADDSVGRPPVELCPLVTPGSRDGTRLSALKHGWRIVETPGAAFPLVVNCSFQSRAWDARL